MDKSATTNLALVFSWDEQLLSVSCEPILSSVRNTEIPLDMISVEIADATNPAYETFAEDRSILLLLVF